MTSTLPRALLASCFISTILVSGLANAQTIPGAAQPGRERDSFAPLPTERSTDELLMAPSVLLDAPENAKEIKFTLKSVEIIGNTAFSNEELAGLYKDMVGQEISLAEVYTIANEITAHYRSKGFLISQAIVPSQEVNGGRVKIRVVEGFIDKIEFRNETGTQLNQRLLNKASDRMRAEKPFSQQTLERQMLLLNDLPGVEARAVVSPSEDVLGAANLVVEIKQKRFSGEVQVDNRGSRFVGPLQVQARGSMNGVFMDYDQLSLLYAAADEFDELNLGEIRHVIPIGDNGLKGSWRVEKSSSAPGFTLESFDVKGRNLTVETQLSYPLLRGRQANAEVFGALSWQDLRTTSLGAALSDETLSTLHAGVNFGYADQKNGQSSGIVSVSKGLNLLGASKKGDALASRLGSEPQFLKVNLDLQREQFFPESRFSLLTALLGQYSADSLPAAHEFGLGGSRFGRSYDASEITGDSGIAGKLELRYTAQPQTPSFIKTYQPYAYYDLGMTNDNHTVADNGRRSLASAGAGARFSLAGDTTLQMELTKPLTRDVGTQGDKDWRAFFGLSKSF